MSSTRITGVDRRRSEEMVHVQPVPTWPAGRARGLWERSIDGDAYYRRMKS